MIILIDPLMTNRDSDDVVYDTRIKDGKNKYLHTVMRGHNVTHKQTRTKGAILFIQ